MAYWLDELPSQSVLDGLESLSRLFRSNLELSPVSFSAVLPTYVGTSDYLEYEQRFLVM